jgi:Domain of unknown function (DUF5615)
MPRKFYKHKLLLDELMYTRQSYPRLNQNFDVKHIREDLHLDGSKDRSVYELASKLGRIIVTANGRHFRKLVQAGSSGVIDFPAEWAPSRVDTKLTALRMRHDLKYFAGHYRTLATEQPA